jgi:hypothetical protein
MIDNALGEEEVSVVGFGQHGVMDLDQGNRNPSFTIIPVVVLLFVFVFQTLRLKELVDANAPKKKKKGGKKKKKKSAITMESDEDDWAPPVSKKKKKTVKKTKPIKKATSSSLSSLASHAMPAKKMPKKKVPVVKKVVLAKIAQPKKTAKTHNNLDVLASLDDSK